MTDLTDILGRAGASADPGTVALVGSQLGAISDTADAVRTGLASLRGLDWTGTAAEAYREQQSAKVPGELDKVRVSFGEASSALSTYAQQLEDILERANALVIQSNDAAETLSQSRATESRAAQALEDTRAAHAATADPSVRASLEPALNSASLSYSDAVNRRESAEGDVRRLDRAALDLRNELEDDAATCATRLHDASEAGMRNTFGSWLHRHVEENGLVRGAEGLGKDVWGVAANFMKSEGALLDSAYRLATHPSWDNLDRFNRSLSDWVEAVRPILEAAAAVVLVVGAVVLLCCAPETILAVLPAVGEISEALTATSVVLDGVKTGSDVYLTGRGEEKDPESVLTDDFGEMALDVAGWKAGKALKLDTSEDSEIEDLDKAMKGWKGQGPVPRTFVKQQIDALEKTKLKDYTVDLGQHVLSVGLEAVRDHPNVAVPILKSMAPAILGPTLPLPAPLLAEPWNSLPRGPLSLTRITGVMLPAMAGAPA